MYHAARARVGAGRCELALGRTAEAAEDLEAAAETFELLRAVTLQREVDLLRDTGAPRAQRRSG